MGMTGTRNKKAQGSGFAISAKPILLAVFAAAGCLIAMACFASSNQLSVTINSIDTRRFPQIQCRVSVKDREGNSLTGLTADRFQLYEDNRQISDLRVTSEIPGKERIAIELVIDRSSSMRGKPLAEAKKAAADFVSRMSRNDLLGITTFSSKVDPSTELTADREKGLPAFEKVRPRGETALYDAVSEAIAKLAAVEGDRKAVVALTDGWDNASSAKPGECTRAAQEGNVAIYFIGLGSAVKADILKSIARESGGNCFFTDSSKNLTDIYRKIAGEIRTQYLLNYESIAGKTRYRTVKVRVSDEGSEGGDIYQYIVPDPAAPHSRQAEYSAEELARGGIGILLALNAILIAAILVRWRPRK